jgi:hypothetical protein
MVKVIRFDEDGSETAVIELDDFTIETVYAGLSDLLKDAAATTQHPTPCSELSRESRQRRQRILTRIQG